MATPNVEKDSVCKQPADSRAKFMWMSPSDLARHITAETTGQTASGSQCLVVDMRSFSLYCGKHIQSAVSLCFSPILMRRLLKGSISLDSLITDGGLLTSIASAERVILYDSSSTPSNVKPEMTKFCDTLQSRFSSTLRLHILLGGMETFQSTYPHLCTSEEPGKGVSPTKVAFDTTTINTTVFNEANTPEGTPVEILPFLYLGSAKDSSDLRVLQKMNITAVLNITTSCPNHFESYLEYKSIPVEDTHQADLLSRLQTAISFIDDVKSRGGRVFVHCHAGISRSATVCIAYLMHLKHMTVNDAYKFVQSKRPIISPNLGFMGQLIVHEQNLQSLRTALSLHCSTSTTATLTDTHVSSLSTCSTILEQNLPIQTAAVETVDSSSSTASSTAAECPNRLPLLKTTRSISVPSRGNTGSKSREGLRLSLNNERRKSSTQVSPCRVEASKSLLTLSLNLPTTCT